MPAKPSLGESSQSVPRLCLPYRAYDFFGSRLDPTDHPPLVKFYIASTLTSLDSGDYRHYSADVPDPNNPNQATDPNTGAPVDDQTVPSTASSKSMSQATLLSYFLRQMTGGGTGQPQFGMPQQGGNVSGSSNPATTTYQTGSGANTFSPPGTMFGTNTGFAGFDTSSGTGGFGFNFRRIGDKEYLADASGRLIGADGQPVSVYPGLRNINDMADPRYGHFTTREDLSAQLDKLFQRLLKDSNTTNTNTSNTANMTPQNSPMAAPTAAAATTTPHTQYTPIPPPASSTSSAATNVGATGPVNVSTANTSPSAPQATPQPLPSAPTRIAQQQPPINIPQFQAGQMNQRDIMAQGGPLQASNTAAPGPMPIRPVPQAQAPTVPAAGNMISQPTGAMAMPNLAPRGAMTQANNVTAQLSQDARTFMPTQRGGGESFAQTFPGSTGFGGAAFGYGGSPFGSGANRSQIPNTFTGTPGVTQSLGQMPAQPTTPLPAGTSDAGFASLGSGGYNAVPGSGAATAGDLAGPSGKTAAIGGAVAGGIQAIGDAIKSASRPISINIPQPPPLPTPPTFRPPLIGDPNQQQIV